MKAEVFYSEEDFNVNDLAHPAWTRGAEIAVEKYWSGVEAPIGRHFTAKLLWSPTAFYASFEATQNEPLIVSETPNLTGKTYGLWERDVCEIFLAPDALNPRRYFEFEIAPNGEWLDLGVRQKPDERVTDWNYVSQMQSTAQILPEKVLMALKIDWKAFGKKPQTDDIWRGNLFRCVGTGETRGYLAWSPTLTEKPNFHVPEKFGEFKFVKD